MLPRHAIEDADWERIHHLLPGQPGQHGKVAKELGNNYSNNRYDNC